MLDAFPHDPLDLGRHGLVVSVIVCRTFWCCVSHGFRLLPMARLGKWLPHGQAQQMRWSRDRAQHGPATTVVVDRPIYFDAEHDAAVLI
jgi:hypothetical protein